MAGLQRPRRDEVEHCTNFCATEGDIKVKINGCQGRDIKKGSERRAVRPNTPTRQHVDEKHESEPAENKSDDSRGGPQTQDANAEQNLTRGPDCIENNASEACSEDRKPNSAT